jgi:uncharacterized protein YdhG (YjbR/CyaY superfamily)
MAKTKETFKTIDEYIAAFPKDVQVILEKFRQAVKEAAPEAEETISYKMPAFKQSRRLKTSCRVMSCLKGQLGFR